MVHLVKECNLFNLRAPHFEHLLTHDGQNKGVQLPHKVGGDVVGSDINLTFLHILGLNKPYIIYQV